MNEQVNLNVEQKRRYPENTVNPETIATIAIELGTVAMEFADIKRVPRYANGERENDAEHSFMLALIGPELATALRLDLDIGLVSQYSNVHDLIELRTGDIATFSISTDALLEKEHNEHSALKQLAAELPPHTANLLVAYESQKDAESKFVKGVDKLLPVVVDIIGLGAKVMEEDYNVSTIEALMDCHKELHTRIKQKYGTEYPDIALAHRILCELFEVSFPIQQALLETNQQESLQNV